MMVNQIFKKKIPLERISDFIKDVSIFEKGIYIFNKYCFKKSILNNKINDFLNSIKEYYHVSKKYYIEREINYVRFATILRQICKQHNIYIFSKIKYHNSTYENIYFIDLTNSITITSK